jgi:hypothetical protein
MDPTWYSSGGNFVGNTNPFGLEQNYLRDTLWREEGLSRQLREQLKRNREKLDKDDISAETKKEIRKKLSALNRRLKRSQKSITAISGNLATLAPQNQVMARNWAAENEYARQLQAVQNQTILNLQSQIQQLSLAAQDPFSPSASMNSPIPTSPGCLWSPIQSDGYLPLYSPFYDPSFQPFNYISGQLFAPSPLRRYSTSISPTDVRHLNTAISPTTTLVTENVVQPVPSEPVAIEVKPRTMSLPPTWYTPKEELKAESDCKNAGKGEPHRHSI